MEGTASYAPVLGYIAETAPSSEFMLVDIGCSGGIDEVWRRFGRRLRAVAIDPNLAEIRRLRSLESHPEIDYVAAYAGLPPGHPFSVRKGERDHWGRNPWDRLSVARSLQILKAQDLSTSQKTAANLWTETELADASHTIVVPDYVRARGITSVDFLKMDIDGPDFGVLNSFDEALDGLAVLGLGLEVSFYGSECDTDQTFHNTDRFMRTHGYDLFNLTVRRYSMAAMPGPYVFSVPAQSKFGRPLQGDALYARDLGNPENRAIADRLPPIKLLNLVCIFAAFNVPDCAAEIALLYRDRLSTLCDVEHVLDLLVAQAQGDVQKPLTYKEYMERFAAQDPMFFPANAQGGDTALAPEGVRLSALSLVIRQMVPGRVLAGLRRFRRAWRALREPSC
jgi:hypothetical protein